MKKELLEKLRAEGKVTYVEIVSEESAGIKFWDIVNRALSGACGTLIVFIVRAIFNGN